MSTTIYQFVTEWLSNHEHVDYTPKNLTVTVEERLRNRRLCDESFRTIEEELIHYPVPPTNAFPKGNTPWNKGKKGLQEWTDEQKQMASERAKQWHKEKGHFGYQKKGFSQEERTRRKQHANSLNTNNLKCPHCGKSGNVGNMKRWHFDNCKLKE